MAENDSTAKPNPTNPPTPLSSPPARKRRRRWPIVIGVILLAIILLVLLAPMIASTSPVRSIVVGKINDNLNGKVQIADWSIGWTGGIAVNGIKVLDDAGRQILQVEKLSTQLSLIDAMRGRFALGKTNVDGVAFDLKIDKDGHNNFERLAKPQAAKASEKQPGEKTGEGSGEKTKLPDVSVDFASTVRGTITQEGQPTVYLDDGSKIAAKITSINDPINETVDLILRVGEGKPGKISLAGTVDAIKNNILAEKISEISAADQSVNLGTIDLGALTPFLKMAKVPLTLAGVVDGGMKVKLAGLNDTAANGEIKIANLEVAGDAFKGGDKFVSKAVSIPVNVTRKVEGSIATIHVENTGITLEQGKQGKVSVVADGPEDALAGAAKLVPAAINRAMGKPGVQTETMSLVGTGKAEITADLDIAGIVSQLSHTIPITYGSILQRGRLTHLTRVTLSNDTVVIATTTDLPDLQGTANGKSVKLNPIHVEAGVTATGGANPDLRDVKIDTRSGFLSVQGGGTTLAKLNVSGNFDLAKMQAELEQFIDLDLAINGGKPEDRVVVPFGFAGVGNFAVNTDGDLTKPDSVIATSAKLDLTDVEITGINSLAAPVHEPLISIGYWGNVQRGSDQQFVRGIQNATVSLTTGRKDAPTVQLSAVADVALGAKITASRFELTKLDVDLAQAQNEFAPMLAPPTVNPYVDKSVAAATTQPSLMAQLAHKDIAITGGRLTGSAAGSYDGSTLALSKPLVLSMQKVTLEKHDGARVSRVLDGETFDVNVAGVVSTASGTSAKLSALTVTSSSNIVHIEKSPDKDLVIALSPNSAPTGSGSLHVTSDLKRAKDLADAFAAAPAVKPDPATELRSGNLDGTLAFAKADKPETSIDAKIALTNLTIGDKLTNETVNVSGNATVPDTRASATASLDVKSAFATVSVPQAQLLLMRGDGKNAKPVGIFEMVRKADATINAPDLAKLYALANAFSPPPPAVPAPKKGDPAPAAPLPPLEVGSGAMTMTMSIARDDAAATTNLNLTDFHVSNLSLHRGASKYAFERDIVLKVAAAIGATGSDIEKIQVTKLDGDFNVATLSMPQPIVITGLSGGARSASGTIAANGSIDRLTPLLAVVQGAQPLPYAGDFSLSQALSTDGDNVALVGDLTTKQFRVLDANDRTKTVFTEPEVAVHNDLSVNAKQQIATIKTLTVNMAGSQALGVKAAGSVEDWTVQRKLNNLKLDLSYDLAKLWPIVHPMLVKPGEDDQFKDLKIAGKYQKTFNVSGSYPASANGQTLQSFESIRTVHADGELAVDLLDTSGATLEQFVLPIVLDGGKLTTSYADKHTAPAAKFNGGTLDLGGIVADLGQKPMRVNIAQKDKKLVQQASINKLLGDTLGKYINPVFANSERAKGLLDVTANYVENVAGDSNVIKTKDSGRAKITFSLTDMDIANPVGSMMFGGTINKIAPLLGLGGVSSETANTFQGQIRDAVVTLDAGNTKQDITMQLVDPTTIKVAAPGQAAPPPPKPMLLSFKGDIRLSDLKQDIAVNLPTELVASLIKQHDAQKILRQAFPSGIPVTLKGTTTKTIVDYGDIGKRIVEGQIKSGGSGALGDVLGGKKDKNATGDGSGAGGGGGDAGALGDILKQIQGDKDKDKSKDKEKEKDKEKDKKKTTKKKSKDDTATTQP